MAHKKHIAVLMGGWSSERPVSLASGQPCAEALRQCGYQVSEVDVDRNLPIILKDLEPDIAFNALHGPYGEDGCVQGLLEIMDIPYTHSGVMASALAMNKEKANKVLKLAGVPVAPSKVVDRHEAAKAHIMPPPYVVKPVSEGSSFGILIVDEGAAEPPQELRLESWPYGDRVMVERFIPGRELTCAVMGEEALGVIDIISNHSSFYDYDAKYAEGGSRHILPAEISSTAYDAVRKFALKAHQALGCRGISRADFRYNDIEENKEEIICLEVNTQPGMTPTSLVPEMATHAGYDFQALVNWMVEDASCLR